MTFGVNVCQCQRNLFGRPTVAQKMMNNAKEDAILVQPFGRSPLNASKSTARDRRLAAVASALGIALELSGDGAG